MDTKLLNYADPLKLENNRLSNLLAKYPGQQLLQLNDYPLWNLNSSPMPHKILLGTCARNIQHSLDLTHHHGLQSTFTHLPFVSDSMNVVLLPHTLELEKNAKLTLNEAWRVLSPNGHLIILGSNPVSFLGMYHFFSSLKQRLPYEHLYTLDTICRWIHYLGGEICHTESFFFRPLLTSTPGKWLFKKLLWLEKLAPWLFPYLGGIYLIVAQKRVKQLLGLNVVWQFSPVLNNKALAQNVRITHDA